MLGKPRQEDLDDSSQAGHGDTILHLDTQPWDSGHVSSYAQSLDSLDNALWGCHQAERPTADTLFLETWIQPWKVPVIWRLALSGCLAVAEHWADATTCGFYHATV